MLVQTTTWDLNQGSQPPILLPTEDHAPCGTWHLSGNLLSGKPVHYQQFCEHWRDMECPACFKRRMRGLRGEINRAYLEGGEEDFHVVLLSELDASALARRCTLEGSLYKRYPTSLWDYIIFQPFLDCPETDMDWRVLDWEVLANTPKGRRPSGKLGVEEKKSKPSPNDYIAEILTAEYDAPAAIIKEAWRLAIEQTGSFNPHNFEQAEQMMNERLNYVSFNIAALGGIIIKTYYRNVRIPENSVLSWNKEETLSELTDLNQLDRGRFDEHGDIIPPF